MSFKRHDESKHKGIKPGKGGQTWEENAKGWVDVRINLRSIDIVCLDVWRSRYEVT